MKEKKQNPLLCAAEQKKLGGLLKKYLKGCRPPPQADPKKEPGRFPNLAGFCAMLGCGVEAGRELEQAFPKLYGHLLAVLEDEALNSGRSPALLNAYLKERLGYGEKGEAAEPLLQPVFEHDILEDGG